MLKNTVRFVIAGVVLASAGLAEQVTVYVDASADGANNGLSWAGAFNSLQDGLVLAAELGADVWVADGTYAPTHDESDFPTTSPYRTFSLRGSIRIFGGFTGDETSIDQRNPVIHATILDGGDEAYHVVTARVWNGVSPNTRLDGFVIRSGRAYYQERSLETYGGGLLAYLCSPTIVNCRFENNSAGYKGGAIAVLGTGLHLANCVFSQNSVRDFGGLGGAVYLGGRSTLVNCVFDRNSVQIGNSKFASGGALMLNADPNEPNDPNDPNQPAAIASEIVGCTFSNNSVGGVSGRGGAIFTTGPLSVYGSILWGNRAPDGAHQIYPVDFPYVVSSTIEDGWNFGADNVELNPLFVNAGGGNLHLQANSPAVDPTGKYILRAVDRSDADFDGDSVEIIDVDIELTPRSTDVLRMGAHQALDCDANGFGDPIDVGPLGAPDCNHNGTPDACEADGDHDGVIDACDGCPGDGAKTTPGACGCGVSDADTDHDGTPDCSDGCDNDASKTSPGDCGCGVAETDSDRDGVPDCKDNCPNNSNADQADADGDGVGDGCEPPAPPVPLVPITLIGCPVDVALDVDADAAIDSAAIAAQISKPTASGGRGAVQIVLELPAELKVGINVGRFVATDQAGQRAECPFEINLTGRTVADPNEDCPELYQANRGFLGFFGIPVGCGPSCLAAIGMTLAGLIGMKQHNRRVRRYTSG